MRIAPNMQHTRGMGTSDLALIEVCEKLAFFGHAVTLYANTSGPALHNGVQWENDRTRVAHADVLVCYRNPNIPATITADKIVFYSMDDIDAPVMRDFSAMAEAFDLFIVLSSYHALQLIKAGAPQDRVKIIPPGVNQWLMQKQLTEKIEKEHAVCYASAPFKGLPLLGRLWPEIRRQNPQLELRVFGDMNMYDAASENVHFKKLYDDMKAMPGVTFFGTLPQHELFPAIARCELMIYPNFFPETFGNVVQESIALGTPVIASDLGALSETIGRAGVLVKGDPKSQIYRETFAATVTNVLHVEHVYQTLYRHAIFQTVQTWENVAIQIIQAIEGATNGRSETV